jgi:hypothetical protein
MTQTIVYRPVVAAGRVRRPSTGTAERARAIQLTIALPRRVLDDQEPTRLRCPAIPLPIEFQASALGQWETPTFAVTKVSDLSKHPVSDEVGAALGAFVAGGAGPRHAVLSRIFTQAGYGSAAPYDSNSPNQQMNKEDRIRVTVSAAVRDPARSRELVDGLLAEFRVAGIFTRHADNAAEHLRSTSVETLRRAFSRIDWELTTDGQLRPAGVGQVSALEGRPAIEDQLARLRRATDDPALLVGTAKEMLESTAKYVLDVFSTPYSAKSDFDELWFHARDRLGLRPEQVDTGQPGGKQVREVLQSSWSIARMTNEVRNVEGTGHGRILPTAMTAEMALLIVREACSVAQMVLSSLDRHLGR